MAGGSQIAGHYKTLIDPNINWWQHVRGWKLMFWVGLYCLGNMANGYDGALVSGLQILPYWQNDFNHPVGSTLGLLGAVQNIGSLGSIPIAPLWNDRFGRRKTIILGTMMMITGAALQAAAKDVNWFLGGRALLGFGGGFNNNADPLMVIELAYPTHRPILSGCYGSLTSVGSIVAAAITFGTYYISSSWSWRLPALIQVIPTVFQMCMVMIGPESPRWLMSKGKYEEAMEVLVYYHGRGDPHDPLVLYEFEEMKKAVEEETANNVGTWASLFNTPGMRRRSFIMMALALSGQWSGNGLVTYYLSPVLNTIGITDRKQQLGINLGLTVWNFSCGIWAGFSADKFGRRRIFLVTTSMMLAFLVSVTICSAQYNLHHGKVAGAFVVVFIYFFTGCYSFGWPGIMLLYVTEIVPTSLRSKGHSLWAITQASFLVFNQYTNPIGFQSLGWKYYIVFDVVMIAILVFLYVFIVETKGLTLEETGMLFDGEDAVKDLQDTADRQAELDAHMSDVVHGIKEAEGDAGSPGSDKASFSHRETVLVEFCTRRMYQYIDRSAMFPAHDCHRLADLHGASKPNGASLVPALKWLHIKHHPHIRDMSLVERRPLCPPFSFLIFFTLHGRGPHNPHPEPRVKPPRLPPCVTPHLQASNTTFHRLIPLSYRSLDLSRARRSASKAARDG